MNSFVYLVDAARSQLDNDFMLRVIGLRGSNPPRIYQRIGAAEEYILLLLYPPGRLGDQQIDEPEVIIWKPGVNYHYGNGEKAWTNSWLRCQGATVGRMIKSCSLPYNTPFPFSPDRFEHYLSTLHDELSRHYTPDGKILKNLFHCLLLEMQRTQHPHGSKTAVPPWLIEVRRWLELNYQSTVNLSRLGREAGVSGFHLTRLFKRHFGTSAGRMLIEVRMAHAREFLLQSDLSVGELAQMVGYQDIYYFSKAFKMEHGVSPSAFRGKARTQDSKTLA